MLPQTRRARSEMATLQQGAEHTALLLPSPAFSTHLPLISPVKMTAQRVPLSDVGQVNERKQLDWRYKSASHWPEKLQGEAPPKSTGTRGYLSRPPSSRTSLYHQVASPVPARSKQQ